MRSTCCSWSCVSWRLSARFLRGGDPTGARDRERGGEGKRGGFGGGRIHKKKKKREERLSARSLSESSDRHPHDIVCLHRGDQLRRLAYLLVFCWYVVKYSRSASQSVFQCVS